MVKLHPDLKRDWIAALRNPLFKQGKGFLQYDGRSCCLDILCQLLAEPLNLNVGFQGKYKSYDGEICLLPSAVMDFTGLDRRATFAPYNTLARLNDSDSRTFSEIADVIEQEF